MVTTGQSWIGRAQAVIERANRWWQASFVGRVVTRYGRHNAGILASGLAYGLLFAFFAGLWTMLSVMGLVFSNNGDFRIWFFDALGRLVPGLVSGSSDSVISDSALAGIGTTFTVTGLFTLAALVWQVIGWLGSLRAAVRTIIDDPDDEFNAVQSKLMDGLAVVLVIVLFVLTALATGVSGGVTRRAASLFSAAAGSWWASAVADVIGFLVTLVLNVLLMLLLLLVVCHIHQRRQAVITAVLGAVALSVVQMLGARLIGGASSNPLLAPFAAIIGVLLWFNIIAQIFLYSAAFLAERIDAGHDVRQDAGRQSRSVRKGDDGHGRDSRDSTQAGL